jgi:photosystem II stability/assembly factor-like uncharacterized protein
VSTTPVAPGGLGIYRSADKGETWQEINVYPTAQGVKSLSSLKVYRLFNDPSDPNALYMASRSQGLFYSYDKGDSWQMVPFFAGKFVYSLAIDPVDKCTIYATDGGSVFLSDDCNRTWKQVYASQRGSRIVSVVIDYADRNNILVAMEDGSVLQSLNSGASWRVLKSFGGTIRELVADPKNPGRLYAASSQSGVARSDDSGKTWIDIRNGLENYTEGLSYYRLVLDPSTKDSIYWLSKYGIFHSVDAGQTWQEIKLVTSPGTVNIYNLAVNPANPKELAYTATIFGADSKVSSSKLYKSIDGGVTWFNRKLPSSAVPVFLYAHPTQAGVLYAAFTSIQ